MPKLPKDLPALLCVHFAVLVAAFGPAWFAHTQATKYPLMDEWDLLHGWVESFSTREWLWAHSGEYRSPLAKAAWLGILRATGYDFSSPQYASVALLIATSVLFLWTARGLRGRAHPADSIFPALMLHLGHGSNLQMGYQVGYTLFAYGIAGWLWCAGQLAQGGGRRWGFLSSLYAGSLMSCGGFGFAFTPVVVVWFAVMAVRFERSGHRFTSVCFSLLHFAALALGISTALAMPAPPTPLCDPLQQPWNFSTGVIGFLMSAVGSRSEIDWELATIAGIVLAIYAVAFVALAKRIHSGRPPRIAAAASLLVLVGMLLGGATETMVRGCGFTERNTSIGAAGLCAALLGLIAAHDLRPRSTASRAAGIVGLLLSGGILWANVEPGLNGAFKNRDSIHHLNLDIQGGESPMFLAGKHGGSRSVLMGDRFAVQLRAFKRAGIPLFADLPDDPPHYREPVPIEALPLRWSHPLHDFEAGSPAPMIGLPLPPAGAIGLRLGVATEYSTGRMILQLRYLDGSGQPKSASAQAPYFGGRMHLTFRFAEPLRAPLLTADSPLGVVVIESAEWLMPGRTGTIGR